MLHWTLGPGGRGLRPKVTACSFEPRRGKVMLQIPFPREG